MLEHSGDELVENVWNIQTETHWMSRDKNKDEQETKTTQSRGEIQLDSHKWRYLVKSKGLKLCTDTFLACNNRIMDLPIDVGSFANQEWNKQYF